MPEGSLKVWRNIYKVDLVCMSVCFVNQDLVSEQPWSKERIEFTQI